MADNLDFADDQPTQGTSQSVPRTIVGGANPAPNFAAVRDRGILNAGLDGLSKRYEEGHKGESTRWVRYQPDRDNGLDEVINYEGMGYKVVEYPDLGEGTVSSKSRTGPVKRGDLVLMAAPNEIHNLIRLQDAQAAEADRRLPQTAFQENLDKTRVRRSDGETDQARMTGTVKEKIETVAVPSSTDTGGESK